jgi:cytochrome c peroxidase
MAVYDLAAKEEAARVAVLREPVAAAVTPDGAYLFVANHLPVDAADLDYVAAVVSVIDTSAWACVATIQLPNGSTGLRGICVSPDGAHVYATHILGRYQLPTTQLERGWMNTNALSVIDVAGKKLLNTVLLDEVDRGAANPWGVACSDDGKWICVAHAGTHEVSVIDRAALHDKLARVARGEPVSEVSHTPEDVPNDLAFLVGMRRRLRLAGNGARGLAILGTKAYATEYFSGGLGVVDLDPEVMHRPKSLALGPEQEMSTLRKGEMYFNDAALCFQNWQSCASCHPDVRADGLNWDLLNDGMGNPKNTKSLVLSHETPPAMISGVRDKAETAVRSGIKYIQFAVRPEEDAEAIDEYLKSLAPDTSPHLKDGKLSEAAERGRDVFERAKCGTCHSGRLYTDLGQYDVGTGKDRELGLKFDTPTLIETWRTAPYLHDGRAVTMEAVFREHNARDQHGVTSSLTDDQLRDLAAFVLSL